MPHDPPTFRGGGTNLVAACDTMDVVADASDQRIIDGFRAPGDDVSSQGE